MRAFVLALALAVAPVAAFAQSLTVVAPNGQTRILTPADLADLPRAEVKVTLETGAKTYEGPILTYVLRAGGLPVGPKLHGDPLRAYVVMTGKDGFQALYALAELDKDFHDDVVILADHVDGKPLPEKEAPWRVASSGDKKGWRSVFGLARIEARTADAPAKAPAMDHQH
ncbi:MAG: molybdopterin-dependent oxidoreductase [Phenylobacterium sp.]|uniref:molybdopterin-dependent oxidoreductase n=1 Tax=Phenylobacterium sp. TaxID=1871053 RepID=UPI001B71E82D|nr:molybdopterin-dependent oxidoreductase [Phenylobacterium sp.]MBP7650044.1 molybdopterin-dependent oxidoreductase [Phenylobacterium sp.]MBP7815608.1 molybdopterin-dependent oxidoreductase [Phenylobacterium sp.]MBP9231688.1 molybdopterin-dependent oxidoreductase [Phenylobacterium sp.]